MPLRTSFLSWNFWTFSIVKMYCGPLMGTPRTEVKGLRTEVTDHSRQALFYPQDNKTASLTAAGGCSNFLRHSDHCGPPAGSGIDAPPGKVAVPMSLAAFAKSSALYVAGSPSGVNRSLI